MTQHSLVYVPNSYTDLLKFFNLDRRLSEQTTSQKRRLSKQPSKSLLPIRTENRLGSSAYRTNRRRPAQASTWTLTLTWTYRSGSTRKTSGRVLAISRWWILNRRGQIEIRTGIITSGIRHGASATARTCGGGLAGGGSRWVITSPTSTCTG